MAAQASKDKRDKQQQNKIPGLLTLNPSTNQHQQHKKDKKQTKNNSSGSANSSGTTTTSHKNKDSHVKSLTEAVASIELNSDEDILKQLKKLRKKIREIDAIEEKLKNGDLKNPEQDQLDKVARKKVILKQIKELELLQPPTTDAAGSASP